jgi:tetratricopeptide (TPR) repeat protein
LSYARNLVSTLERVRRWDEAIAAQRRVVALVPGRVEEEIALAGLSFSATGSEKEGDALFARQPPAMLESPRGIIWRKGRAYWDADLAEFRRLDQLQPFYDDNGTPRSRQTADHAGSYFILGDKPGALARMGNLPEEMRAQLVKEPANARMWSDLGFMECIRGNKAEALRCARKPSEILPEARDALDGPRYSVWFAETCLWCGEKEQAITEYARLLKIPSNLNVHDMKRNPFYAPLRGDPRWEALLNDPKNNEPLF